MSGAMEKLIAALEANTAAHEKVLAALSGGKASGGKTADKPADKPAPKSAGKKKATTVEDIADAFGKYLGIKDADERAARKENVKAIVDYFGAAKATEIDPASFDEALGYLKQYIDGETPEFDGGGEEGGDDESLV